MSCFLTRFLQTPTYRTGVLMLRRLFTYYVTTLATQEKGAIVQDRTSMGLIFLAPRQIIFERPALFLSTGD